MLCLEILVTPDGDAPEWVRKHWIGLFLPLERINPLSPPGSSRGFLTGHVSQTAGYRVSRRLALDMLASNSTAAAQWFEDRINCADDASPFVFDARCGILVEESERNLMAVTVAEFLALLEEEISDRIRGMYTRYFGSEPYLCMTELPISDVLVIVLARLLAWSYMEEIHHVAISTWDEQGFSDLHAKGHAVLQALAEYAKRLGIAITSDEIDIPLSLVDSVERAGIIEADERGLKLTARGESIVKDRVRRSRADSN